MTPRVTNASAVSDGRLRYDPSHWARDEDEEKALEQYLRLADKIYNRTKLKLLIALAGDLTGKRVLDYGGGAGIIAVPFARAGAHVVIVDAEASALRTARLYAKREGVDARIETIHSESFPASLRDGSRFDVIVAKDIVEHIVDDELFLRDLSSCQADGGILLLSTQSSLSLNYLIEGAYQKFWLGNRNWLGWDKTHVRFYTPASLRRKLEQAGYVADRWAGVFIVPYNLASWFTLLRADIQWSFLHYFDLTLGRMFPFNRFGWNVLVRGRKARRPSIVK